MAKEIKTIKLDDNTIKFYKCVRLGRIAQVAYEKYKFLWIFDHVGNVEDLIDCIEEEFSSQKEEYEDATPLSAWNSIVEGNGFEGEMYVSYREFLQNEFTDKDVAKSLLEAKDYEMYEELYDVVQELTKGEWTCTN